ncbi:UNVERIFIED_CONTAM: hypothetical protein Sradi_1325500 [Sesamum radiatum]|uniref:Transposase (putative) gypsy type domain-containing protein n=1 Tax=Sesamum radiatum TaxID=300843 RepID=A0AAW2UQI3_SESRA
MGSNSSQKLVSSPVHVQSDELESSVAPQSKLRCRIMDVENCDSSLSLEEFDFLKKKVDPSSAFDFRLPRVGDRIRMPPPGYFTVYSAFFSSGFTLPPHPLLMDIIKKSGLCVSQFTPNSFTYFEGFLYRFRELGLPLTIESFFTLFSVRKVANDSFFFFFPRSGCRFLDGSASSKGPWKEKFFYVRDSDWDFATNWGEVSPVLRSSHDFHLSFIGTGLFDQLLDVKSLLASGRGFRCRTFSTIRLTVNESSMIAMGELVLLLHREKKARGVALSLLPCVLARWTMVKEDLGRIIVLRLLVLKGPVSLRPLRLHTGLEKGFSLMGSTVTRGGVVLECF